ncbi:MAG TPA: hypothetical protein EYH02_04595 [Ignisphaera aggregans]|uniref:Uncharacterized protein n=1 Tax=Ignisphaera aggregans TaxID=334771 RepID=A0A832YYT8_9CREN|nr:hypothetical protein [Ignisphaera aggregans]
MPRYMIELLQRYYHCLGYYVRISIPIPYKKRIHGVEKTFYKFLDLAALNDRELLLIECKSFKNVKNLRAALERVCRFYDYVDEALKSSFSISHTITVRKLMFVEDDDLERLKPYSKILQKCGIEIQGLSSIVDELLKCSIREQELRKTRGEGDIVLSIIAFLIRSLNKAKSSLVHERHT